MKKEQLHLLQEKWMLWDMGFLSEAPDYKSSAHYIWVIGEYKEK